MASLTGQTIQSTYDSLLKISGNDPLTASLQRITDGLGNFTPLYLSTTAVEISSGLNVIGSITGSNLSGTNTGDETNSSIKTKLGAASASQDGYLTSTDWSTFNAKQPALGYTPVPQTRTLTINGTTFDLSADRSWTISTGVTRSQILTALGTGGSPFEFLKSDGSVDTNSYVTFGRTLTINGETYDLSANRSWTIASSQWITSGSSIYYNTGTVGIGTTTPDSLLHLQSSTVDTRINLNSTNASLTPYIMFKSLGVNKATIGLGQYTGGSLNNLLLYCDSGDTIFSNNVERMRIINTGQLRLSSYTSTSSFTGTAAGYLAFDSSGNIITTATPSTSQWITSGSNIYYNTGNVGIGVAPSAWDSYRALQLSGGGSFVSFGNAAEIWSNSIYDGANKYISNGFATRYHLNNDGGFVWYTAPSGTAGNTISFSERMRITSGGNVGIGTTSPGARLHVIGTSILDGNTLYRLSGTNIVNIGSDQNMYGGSNSDGGVFVYGNNKLHLSTNSVRRLTVDGSGNVGIGTTNPGQRLQVGDGTSTNSQYARFFHSASDIYIGQSGGTIFGLAANSGGYVLSDNSSFPFGIGTTFSQPVIFGTNNSERMRITSTGNVGIGTTSPAQRLDVDGNVRFANLSSGSTSVFINSADTGTSTINFGGTTTPTKGRIFYSDNSDFLSMWTGSSERMRITSSGNVGIGTTSPAEKLDVIGGAVAAGNGTIRTGITYSSLGLIGTFTNHDLGIITNGSERMRITSGGNVGIGTSIINNESSGRTVLELNGSSQVLLNLSTASTRRGYLFHGGTDMSVFNDMSGALSFGTNATERMRITSGGSVAINTLGGPVINNTTLSLRSINTTATDRVIEGYSIGFSALFYVQNNGSYFFAGSNLSDERTKKDISYLNDSVLDKVMQLKPASFKYIQNDENVKGGFIAQDVKEIFPDLVTKTQSEEDMMGVDYYGVIGILTKAIQEQQAQINELKARLENGI